MSPTEIAGMALPAVVWVVSPAEFSKKRSPAVAKVESLIVGEVASSTDLVQDDMVTIPNMALFPESVEVGEPTEVVHPIMRGGVPDTDRQDYNVGSTERQIGIDMSREERQLTRL